MCVACTGKAGVKKTFAFYDEVFNRYPSGKFHALGNANPLTLEPYPFTSFDSTGWQRDAGYSNDVGWPYNRCTRTTRMLAYIEATTTIEHRPPRQLGLRWRATDAGAQLEAIGGAA